MSSNKTLNEGSTSRGLLRQTVAWAVGPMEALGALACIATLAGFLGGVWWGFDLFSHFRVQYLAVLTVTAAAAVVGRHHRMVLLLLFFACVNGALILPFYLGGHAAAAGTDSPVVRAALFNVNSGSGDPARVIKLLADSKPDVLVLLEISARWEEPLAEALSDYPHNAVEPREDNFGIAFFSRLPVVSAKVVYMGNAGVPSIIAKLKSEERSFTVIATHPLPPMSPRYATLRDEQLEYLSEAVQSVDTPIVVFGDLNATPWSRAFRRFKRETGLRDSMRGWGVQPTWPTFNPLLGIPIDHCLHSQNVAVIRRERGPRAGSDHLPVFVDFSFTDDER